MIYSRNSYSVWQQYKQLSTQEKGFMLLLLVAVMPLTYKIISPIFIILGFGGYTEYITPALYIVGLVMSRQYILKSITSTDVFAYLLFGALIFGSQLIYPDTRPFIDENFHDFILYVVPFFFLGLTINYERHRDLLRIVVYLAFFIQLFWEACMLGGLVDIEPSDDGTMAEQMDNAYSILFSVTYMVVEYNRSHRKFDLVLVIVGSILLLMMGARGPVMVYLFFILCYFLIFKTFDKNNKMKKIGVAILCSGIYYFIKPITMLFYGISLALGFSTKIFDSILSDSMVNIHESSGRDEIYEDMIRAIKNDSTWLGYGFGGDRLFSQSHGYAHNFELEILVECGIIGGSIIFIALLIYFISSLKKVKGTYTAQFWFVLFCWGFMSLQFSMSWIIRPAFFLLIGYCLSIRRNTDYLSYNS